MKNRVLFFLCFLFPLFCVNAEESRSPVFLVFGGETGWLGQKIVHLLKEQNRAVFSASSRLERREEIEREIESLKPDFIINAAGVTGRPNIDWCEEHQIETIRSNLLGALNLFDIAYQKGIHVTNLGTGCIYEYDENHPIHSGIGFTESDPPNFDGSFYSWTKTMLDPLVESYPNVLNLRLRMPVSSDLHPRNFITKITRYKYVINIPNSMTVLDDLLPLTIEMALRGCTGNYNFTNPGTISHNEVLALYKEYVDPSFTWKNFTIEEMDRIIKAKRSNNELDVSKLLHEFPDIPEIHDSMRKVFEKFIP